jgi:hypothetical protein
VTDTLFSDVSEFQTYVNDSYPHRFISFRSNDGTYRDNKFSANLAWAKNAVAKGKLTGFIVYFVYEPNWQETVATLKAMVGSPHPKMSVMIDVENWSGRIWGNHSAQINASRESIIAWLGGNRKRVIGYGNMSDLANLWPSKGDSKVIVAAYGSNPSHPAKIAHQFADNFNTPPFGPCDGNSADGYAPADFANVLGIGSVAPKPTPTPVKPNSVQFVIPGKLDQKISLRAVAASLLPAGSSADAIQATLVLLIAANPQLQGKTYVFGGHVLNKPYVKFVVPGKLDQQMTLRDIARYLTGETASATEVELKLQALVRANPVLDGRTSWPGGHILNRP